MLFEDEKKEALHDGHRARLRARFLKSNGEGMPDYEMLELLLFASSPRRDVKPTAKKLLEKFGSLNGIFKAENGQLLAVSGMNEQAVTAIKTCLELSSRLLREEMKQGVLLNNWQHLLDYCRLNMGNLKKEQFRIIFVNQKNRVIADEVQQEGSINHTPVYVREVVKRALELGASSIILAHNHPSGDTTPSPEDIEITKQIAKACEAVGIRLHDHLIIGDGDHYSMKSNHII